MAMSTYDGVIWIFDIHTLILQRALTVPEAYHQYIETRGPRVIPDMALSPDGKILLDLSSEDSSGYKVRRWDLVKGEQLPPFAEDLPSLWQIAFSPDGALVAISMSDQPHAGRRIELRRAISGDLVAILRGQGLVGDQVTFSPDGHLLATAAGDAVQLWDVEKRSPVRSLKGHGGAKGDPPGWTAVGQIAFSRDGKLLVSASRDDVIRLWNPDTGELLRSIAARSSENYCVATVALSPDGRILASDAGPKIKLWNSATGRLIDTLEDHTGSVYSLVFTPDGSVLASGSEDGTLRLWDVRYPK